MNIITRKILFLRKNADFILHYAVLYFNYYDFFKKSLKNCKKKRLSRAQE